MIKQEEIREEIDEKRETILNFIRAWGVIKHPYGSRDAEECLAMLSELGVVIKVDRELPDDVWASPMNTVEHDAQQLMLKAGYVATIPIIEESK